jgi:hypothetical protein
MAVPNRAGNKQAGPAKKLKSGVSPDVGKKTQFKKGESGNPAGLPKGTKHLSTHIQELLNDPEFEYWVKHPTQGFVKEKGVPVKAMVGALIVKAVNGDTKAFDSLAKAGYGSKVEVSGPDGGPVQALVEFIGDETEHRQNPDTN